ncbi:MAG: hypothetical protein EHM19_08890 [Candidatus Latescibacterota bacterium]|nr:MAG: hypothetical protein EHM19_08890 [Candidatus Latescibacterota bacterium]
MVRFSRPGGDLLSSGYTLTLYAESTEGRRNLDLLLEKIWREERPARLYGAAEIDEIAERPAGLIALSGGLTGPISGAFARGRVGEAKKVASILFDLFGGDRFFLEISRSGSPREAVAEPFVRELAARFGLRTVAADPIRSFRPGDGALLRKIRSLVAPPSAEDPPDAFVADDPAPPLRELASRYEDDPVSLRASREIAGRAAPPPAPVSLFGRGEADEIIRGAVAEMEKRYSGAPHWKRKEGEARFWEEFWGIGEARHHAALLLLSRVFRTLRRAQPDAEVSTPFLSGSLVGFLAGLQPLDPEEAGVARSLERQPGWRILVEADRASAVLLRRLLADRCPGPAFPALLPIPVDEEAKENVLRFLARQPGEESGPNPHPPTANPAGDPRRGKRGPDPLSLAGAERLLAAAVAGYRRSPHDFVGAEETSAIWDLAGDDPGHIRFLVRESPLLTTLRATRALDSNGDPFAVLRQGGWTALLDGSPPVEPDLAASLSPRSETDLMLLMAAGNGPGARRDLVDRIAAVRAGKRPAPVAIPRLAPILRETDGVPFFQEQMVGIIENLTGCPRGTAETLFRDLRIGEGPKLAGERALFVRRAADRGVPPGVAARVFSLLLALASHATCAGDLLPLARRTLLAAGRKSLDPVAFAASALNALLGARRRQLQLVQGFRREGVRFLPLDRNASGFEFRVEGDAVRHGLGVVPGMTRELGGRLVEERERGGAFGSDADLLGRLAACRFPRSVLEELGIALRAEGASPAGETPAAGAAVPARPAAPALGAREAPAARPYRSGAPGRPGRRPGPRVLRRGEREAQTAFEFPGVSRAPKGRREGKQSPSGKREE